MENIKDFRLDTDCYTLSYTDGDYKITVKFSTDIDLGTLKDNLRYFLSSCSWTNAQIEWLFGEESNV